VTYNRIMIFGRPGSGKSTFALMLHNITFIPLYHLDKYFFSSNWKEVEYKDFLEIQKSIVDQEKWIIDGNSTKSFEVRYARANLPIYFNYPRYICYWRVFKRLFYKNKCIDDRTYRLGRHMLIRMPTAKRLTL
jgi:adenylate kinase family enzyme